MIKTVVIIIISFFAVIGFLECILTMLETISTLKYKNFNAQYLTAELEGNVPNVNFLLGTLLLQAERISYKNVLPSVVIKDVGLDENTYSQIRDYCLENDNIMLEK